MASRKPVTKTSKLQSLKDSLKPSRRSNNSTGGGHALLGGRSSLGEMSGVLKSKLRPHKGPSDFERSVTNLSPGPGHHSSQVSYSATKGGLSLLRNRRGAQPDVNKPLRRIESADSQLSTPTSAMAAGLPVSTDRTCGDSTCRDADCRSSCDAGTPGAATTSAVLDRARQPLAKQLSFPSPCPASQSRPATDAASTLPHSCIDGPEVGEATAAVPMAGFSFKLGSDGALSANLVPGQSSVTPSTPGSKPPSSTAQSDVAPPDPTCSPNPSGQSDVAPPAAIIKPTRLSTSSSSSSSAAVRRSSQPDLTSPATVRQSKSRSSQLDVSSSATVGKPKSRSSQSGTSSTPLPKPARHTRAGSSKPITPAVKASAPAIRTPTSCRSPDQLRKSVPLISSSQSRDAKTPQKPAVKKPSASPSARKTSTAVKKSASRTTAVISTAAGSSPAKKSSTKPVLRVSSNICVPSTPKGVGSARSTSSVLISASRSSHSLQSSSSAKRTPGCARSTSTVMASPSRSSHSVQTSSSARNVGSSSKSSVLHPPNAPSGLRTPVKKAPSKAIVKSAPPKAALPRVSTNQRTTRTNLSTSTAARPLATTPSKASGAPRGAVKAKAVSPSASPPVAALSFASKDASIDSIVESDVTSPVDTVSFGITPDAAKAMQEKIDGLENELKNCEFLWSDRLSTKQSEHLASESNVREREEMILELQRQIDQQNAKNNDTLAVLDQSMASSDDRVAALEGKHRMDVCSLEDKWKSEVDSILRSHTQQLEELDEIHKSELSDHQQSCSRLEDTLSAIVSERDAALGEVSTLKSEKAEILQKGSSHVLTAEVESLKVVLDMKSDEVKELRCKNLDLQVKLEKLDAAWKQAEYTRAKNEELRAQLDHTRSLHRTAEAQARVLQDRTDDLDKSHQQLTREKEELQWLLQTPKRSSEAASAVSDTGARTPHYYNPTAVAMSTPASTF